MAIEWAMHDFGRVVGQPEKTAVTKGMAAKEQSWNPVTRHAKYVVANTTFQYLFML